MPERHNTPRFAALFRSWTRLHGLCLFATPSPSAPNLALAPHLQHTSLPPRQVIDYGDLSRLLRPAYQAALQAALAAAEPFEISYKRDAPKPQPGKTYLIPYVIERYSRVALKLKLWPYPRGHHQHVAIIPWE